VLDAAAEEAELGERLPARARTRWSRLGTRPGPFPRVLGQWAIFPGQSPSFSVG
jgi:hypothetical protein